MLEWRLNDGVALDRYYVDELSQDLMKEPYVLCYAQDISAHVFCYNYIKILFFFVVPLFFALSKCQPVQNHWSKHYWYHRVVVTDIFVKVGSVVFVSHSIRTPSFI